MADLSTLLNIAASNYQRQRAQLDAAVDAMMNDLYFLRGSDGANVTDYTGQAQTRMESAAEAVGELGYAYIIWQLMLMGVGDPKVARPDMSFVQADLRRWVPAPMVQAVGRQRSGEPMSDVLVDLQPKVEREVEAFLNEVEGTVVEQMLDSVDEFLAYTDQRPLPFEIDGALPTPLPELTNGGLNIVGALDQIEAYTNHLGNKGYRTTKLDGRKLMIQILPQANACGFCVVRADRLYTAAVLHGDNIRSHAYCRCGWRTVTSHESKAWTQDLTGDKWKDVIDRRSTPDEQQPDTQGGSEL